MLLMVTEPTKLLAIRVCLSDKKQYIHMTYRFNAVTPGTIYDKLNRYLKKRQNIYI